MIQKLTNLFKKKDPIWNKKSDYVIEYAFTFDGVDYYQMSDYINIPCERAFTAMAYYEEFKMKCDKNFLIAHTEAIENACNNGKLNEVVRLTQDIRQRLSFISDPDLLLKLASVVFFDIKEDPTIYDFGYNEKKINNWKKHKLKSFFQALPLSNLIPSLDFSKIDLETFTKMNQEVRQITIHHIDRIISNLSQGELSEGLRNDLQLQKESLAKLLQLED